MNREISFVQKTLASIGGMLFVLLVWSAFSRSGVIEPLLLPPPRKVFFALIELVKAPGFWLALISTIWAWLGGVLLGFVFGGALGLTLGSNRYIWAAFEPFIEFLRALPSVVLVPLVSLFCGVSGAARLTSSTIVVLVLMTSTSAAAFSSAKSGHMRLAKAWRATPLQELRYFVMPSILSQMAVALRAAIPIALIVAVAADMLIATESGIGKIIMDSLAVFDTPKMYAAVIVVGCLGYIAALIGLLIEHSIIHWRNA